MTTPKHDLIIVGGGISGLGFAQIALRHGLKPLLIEAEDRYGGCIHSHTFDEGHGGYWAELGAHTCYNSYGHLLSILDDLNLLDQLQAKLKLRFKMQIGDSLLSIPSQLNLIELLGLPLRLFGLSKERKTAAEFYGRLIGRRNFERVLGPALDAVACQFAGGFPADALFKKKPRRKEVMRSYTGQHGLQSFIDGMTARDDFNGICGHAVSELKMLDAGYQLTLSNGEVLVTSKLVFAIAPDQLASLLKPESPALAEQLTKIEMVEIETLGVLLRAEDVSLSPLAGIIGKQDDFYSVVSRDLVQDERYRAFTFHFRPHRLDMPGKLKRICEVLGITEDRILDKAEKANRLPKFEINHRDKVAPIETAIAQLPLALVGNWFDGLSIEDSLIRAASEFDRLYPELRT